MSDREVTLDEGLQAAGRVLVDTQSAVIELGTKTSDYDSLVTEADLRAESEIVSLIRRRFPQDGVVAEETGTHNAGQEYTWVIDPLDGTSNYAAGLPLFGVSIGLLQNHVPVLGGITLPSLQETYIAHQGQGAYLNGQSISTNTKAQIADVLVSYPIGMSDEPGKLQTELALCGQLVPEVRSLRMLNVATVELCFVASGRLGATLARRCRIWDVAAGALIVLEAGGVVTDFRGASLQYVSVNERYEYIVASNAEIHGQIIDAARSVERE